MKDKLNLLFYCDITSPINKFPIYYVENLEDNLWIISDAPLVCKGKISNIVNHLCFDFDDLDEEDKKKYEMKMTTFTNTKSMTPAGTNIYKQETKIYKKSI